MSVPVSCIECGSAVPDDAPDGICPSCLWQLAVDDGAVALATDSTAAGSTIRTLDGSDITPLLGGAPWRTTTQERSPAVLRRLGNYDLLEELGRGGMGIVYKAVQREADRLVAVKLILGGSGSSGATRERFRAEVQTLARLKHTGIVPVFEVGDEDGCPYYSMEYMPGGTLSQQTKQGLLPPEQAAAIVEQLALAVQAAHEVGVLHRDIKPSNVLLDAEGRPKLSDFGLAKRLDDDESLTNTGSVLGTPGYMPPEQARGLRDLTVAADVYSLGATLFALLTGRPPFSGHDFHDTVQRVIHDDPPRPRAKRPEIARDLEAVCLKCLEKDPARRYASAQSLADDLARWRQGASTVARPQGLAQRTWRQLRRYWRALAVAAALLVAVTSAALVIRSRDPLVALDSALRRGQTVTLVGRSGPPRWHRWQYGAGGMSTSDTGTLEVFAASPSHIELIPPTHHPRFRLSAEFRTDRSTNPDSWAGLYVARVGSRSGTGRSIVARFRDDRINVRPQFAKGDPLSVQDTLHVVVPGEALETYTSSLGAVWIEEPLDKAGRKLGKPWRRLVVEMAADGLHVRFFPDASAKEPTFLQSKPIPLATLDRLTEVRRDRLVKDYPEQAGSPVEFNPAGGCGLYVHHASVSFRNVVFEPLP